MPDPKQTIKQRTEAQLKKAAAIWSSEGASSTMLDMAKRSKQEADRIKREAREAKKATKKKASELQSAAARADVDLKIDPNRVAQNPKDYIIKEITLGSGESDQSNPLAPPNPLAAPAVALAAAATKQEQLLSDPFLKLQQDVTGALAPSPDRSASYNRRAASRLASRIQSARDITDEQKLLLLAQLKAESTPRPQAAQAPHGVAAGYDFDTTEFQCPKEAEFLHPGVSPEDDEANVTMQQIVILRNPESSWPSRSTAVGRINFNNKKPIK